MPEFRLEFLHRGHAVHFRCRHPDVTGLRIDIMSQLRGCDSFEQFCERRTTIEDPETDAVYEVVAVEDLVRAKKTQRDKDWPMIRRLVEAHYDLNGGAPTEAMVQFWLRTEEDAQRQADREYWRPLKEELEQLRLNRPRGNTSHG